MKKEKCLHDWELIEKRKAVTNYVKSGFFSKGFIEYGIKILQKCKKCGKYETIRF